LKGDLLLLCDLFCNNHLAVGNARMDMPSNFVTEDRNEGTMYPETISLKLLHALYGQVTRYEAR
ncbi:hypothetical protein, partial [Brevibacillus laterosporus]